MSFNESMQSPEKEFFQQSQFTPGYNDAASISMRIDTTNLKQQIYMYLCGIGYTFKLDDTGKLIKKATQVGKPKVNDAGLQGVMLFVEQFVNNHTVQGNTDAEEFGKLSHDFRKGLHRDLWINMDRYGIDESEYDGICDSICLMAKLFSSRTINNEERESYGKSWQIRDTNTTMPAKRKGILSFLPFMGGGSS
jgi:hypothetical protein